MFPPEIWMKLVKFKAVHHPCQSFSIRFAFRPPLEPMSWFFCLKYEQIESSRRCLVKNCADDMEFLAQSPFQVILKPPLSA